VANKPIFPKKLFKWVILPTLVVMWVPAILVELLNTFHPTQGIPSAAEAGVFWIVFFAFPALVLSIVLVGGIVIIRLIRRPKTRPSDS